MFYQCHGVFVTLALQFYLALWQRWKGQQYSKLILEILHHGEI